MAIKSNSQEQTAANNKFYRATGFTSLKAFFVNYVHFTGRSSRSEYWWMGLFTIIFGVAVFFVLFGALIGALLSAGSGATTESMVKAIGNMSVGMLLLILLLFVLLLACVLPALSLLIRRYRDAGIPWWVYLIQVGIYLVASYTLDDKSMALRVIGWAFDISVLVLTLLPSKPLPVASGAALADDLDDRINPDVFAPSNKEDSDNKQD